MAEFQEVMRNYNRMCDSATRCEDCELHKSMKEQVRKNPLPNRLLMSCPEYIKYFPDKAKEVIQHWAAEHPKKRKKTMLEVLKEHFPKAVEDDETPCICPSRIFGVECKCENGKFSCVECWNRPAPDEYQEKDESRE